MFASRTVSSMIEQELIEFTTEEYFTKQTNITTIKMIIIWRKT